MQLANFLTTIIKKSAKGAAREGTIVPEPPTERLLPEGKTTGIRSRRTSTSDAVAGGPAF